MSPAARKARRRRERLLGAALSLLLLWILGYPLLIVLLEAVGLPGRVTLESVAEFLRRPDEWLALWRSLWISIASVALAAAVGVPLAFLFQRADFPGRSLLGGLVALPIALPPLVGVLAFHFLCGETGFLTRGVVRLLGLAEAPWRLSGPGAILLVHAYSMYVFFYLFTRAALARMDAAQLEAAAILGAGPGRILRRITLPHLAPALAGASLLTFMTSLASFSAPYVFGGGFRVMTTQIAASKLQGNLDLAYVEAVALASLAFAALWVQGRLDPRRELAGGVRGAAPRRRRPGGPAIRVGLACLAWLLGVVLLLPHLTLLLISFVPPATWTVESLPPVLSWRNYAALFSSPERLRPVVNSLWMATAATLGALALGYAVARLSRRLGGRLGALLEALLAVPWAVPGTVFAVSLAATFSVHAPVAGRFVLVGTIWLLPLAYLVRSLPLTGRSSLAGLRQLDPALEEAAESLGAGAWRTFRRVTFPLLRPSLLAGAGLAFITALGDFVTSILLYTYKTRPISIEMLASLRQQETGMAAVFGVFLMAVSAGAFLLWGRERSV